MEKKFTAIILLIFFGLAVLFGFIIEESMNTFFSWILMGLWLLFIIKFFEKIKKNREYNSPHNTSFFIFAPLFVGIFYGFWGYFTIEILGWNLLEDFFLELYFSPWHLIFALPFLLYGIFSIRALFKKYDFVYIIRNWSLKARKFAIIFIILILISVLFYIIFFNWIIGFLEPVVFPNYYYPFWSDLMFWVLIGFLGYFLVRHGIFGKQRSIPQITTDYIAQRRRQLERAATPAIASTASRQYTSSPTSSVTSRPVVSTATKTTPKRQKSSASVSSTPTRPVTTSRRSSSPRRQEVKAVQRPKPSVNFNKLKPKAGILSLDDFKCIFCFQLPSNEDGRGIVLCPKCRHPSHVDEFQNWLKTSVLCSRCDANIPATFRQNPVVVSAKDYSEIINEFKKLAR